MPYLVDQGLDSHYIRIYKQFKLPAKGVLEMIEWQAEIGIYVQPTSCISGVSGHLYHGILR